jgi:hypothetical protein
MLTQDLARKAYKLLEWPGGPLVLLERTGVWLIIIDDTRIYWRVISNVLTNLSRSRTITH